MAGPYYVDSNATGAGTGADWANAYTSLATAVSGKAAGDVFYVAHNHSYVPGSANTIAFPGTAASPNKVYCVNSAGTVPPVSADLRTTGVEGTTGNFAVTLSSYAYIYGLKFNPSTAGGNNNTGNINFFNSAGHLVLDNCSLIFGSTNGFVGVTFGSSATQGQFVRLINCSMTFAATGQGLYLGGARTSILGGTIGASGSIPTSLFLVPVRGAIVEMRGVDLTNLTGTIFGNLSTGTSRIDASELKIHASATLIAAQTVPGSRVNVVRASSSGINYSDAATDYYGSQVQETTIVRTGGASDGTTTKAWKVVTTANSSFAYPFRCLPIVFWNDSTSAITTLTIYGNFTSVPNDDDIWVDVEYLSSSGSPISSIKTSTKADGLAASAATNNTSDGSTWGAGATTAFKITVPSFTPGMKGPIAIYVRAALASSTFYIDPRPSISGVTISKSEILSPGVYANELSSGSGGGLIRHPGMAGGLNG